jgi:hypothetical protein
MVCGSLISTLTAAYPANDGLVRKMKIAMYLGAISSAVLMASSEMRTSSSSPAADAGWQDLAVSLIVSSCT